MEKVFQLSGRIDSNNVVDLESKVLEEIKGYDGEIVFDAKDLSYISSAGLRMILRVKKANDHTKVINCNSRIYEIFEMTGFSEMMDIEKALRTISIDHCEEIGSGFYGKVYRIDPETIVKVYKKDDIEMVKREKELARKAFVLGIPTAIPYDMVRVGNQYGAVFELLECKSLDKLIQEGEDVEVLAKQCVEVLKKMHATEVSTNEFKNRKDAILKTAYDCKDYLSEETMKKLIAFIQNIEDKHTMIHGDFQIKNLMRQGNEILIIDMDTLSYGNPIFEFSGLYAAYVAFGTVNEDNLTQFLGVPYEKTKKLWNTIFESYYQDMEEDKKAELLERIKILSYLQVLFTRTKFRDDSNKFQEEEIEFSKNYITEHISKVVS